MIRDVYKSYFQKSHTFLYPLLRLPKNYGSVNKAPKKTFISVRNLFRPQDMKLIVIFDSSNDASWRVYLDKILLPHHLLEHHFIIEETGELAFVFDMTPFESDYKHFLTGKYSKLSAEARKSISSHYGIHTPEWAYLESFLYPQKYFKDYAQILDIEEQELIKVGELCDRFNEEHETFPYKFPEDLILNKYDNQDNVGL